MMDKFPILKSPILLYKINNQKTTNKNSHRRQMMQQRPDLDKKYIGTCFDRQVRIQLWNQDKLREQTVLVLGVGGLGSVVLMNVLRLGVKKVIIVDYDVVDVHNLNRQIIFGPEDVGKGKVESAVKNSKHHNIAQTEIQGHNINAVKCWDKIIQFAKQSHVVFNCIDYGDKYDIAVASLCMALKLPLVMGGTFATMFTIDYVHYEGRACFLCLGDQGKTNKELVQKITPDKILNLQSLQFLPKNNNPTGRSSMMVCLMCGELMISHYVNYLFLSEDRPYKTTRLIGYHNTFEIIKFDAEIDKKCLFCGDPNYVQPEPQPQTKPQTVSEQNGTEVMAGAPPVQTCEDKNETNTENESKINDKIHTTQAMVESPTKTGTEQTQQKPEIKKEQKQEKQQIQQVSQQKKQQNKEN